MIRCGHLVEPEDALSERGGVAERELTRVSRAEVGTGLAVTVPTMSTYRTGRL